ncbi:16S rRNA (guanine(966)-N(2))-methyltransferase RsmD [Microcella frigidaquae]|uniref:16S rRNA (Guanine966-N2)-methyltransferase n=1 Tax=Microcella frigidaquae TaxID=424758 RepID=A0A840XK82_9MICO|nr:16S rRNA (guanine966-N2)-methyltransferase [Microcella frigidaquae]NHN44120.1 16S rRNA (guanine(966)-N(2))-methyltransferase RsmD [Microcella frigidaquae]
MTRIIAGFAGSLTLKVPSAGTRPTSDRVREAIFSALEARDAIDGMRVLDLYAGSGALALEAISRGAASAVLVEKSHAAVQVCKANAALVQGRAGRGARPSIQVIGKPATSYLSSALVEFDLVFIDPPYEVGGLELDHVLEGLVPRLAPDAVVALERSSRSPAPAWPAGLALDKVSRYGETAVYWLGPEPTDSGTATD